MNPVAAESKDCTLYRPTERCFQLFRMAQIHRACADVYQLLFPNHHACTLMVRRDAPGIAEHSITILGSDFSTFSADATFQVAAKKCMRLANAPPATLSSYQIRNPEKRILGGAIRSGGYVVGPSGLSEHQDEMIACGGSLLAGIISLGLVRRAARLSENKLLDSAIEEIRAHFLLSD